MKTHIKYKVRRVLVIYIPFIAFWTSLFVYGVYQYCCK